MRQIHAGGAKHHQGTHGLDFCFHCGKGTKHIWVIHNWGARFLFQRRALNPIESVTSGLLISPVRYSQTLQANCEPGMIHHPKHNIQPLIFSANKVSNCPTTFAILHYCCRRCFDAKFLFYRQTTHIIGGTQTAIFLRNEFGDDEHGNTLNAGRGALGTG